jgi:hypothetical protein
MTVDQPLYHIERHRNEKDGDKAGSDHSADHGDA